MEDIDVDPGIPESDTQSDADRKVASLTMPTGEGLAPNISELPDDIAKSTLEDMKKANRRSEPRVEDQSNESQADHEPEPKPEGPRPITISDMPERVMLEDGRVVTKDQLSKLLPDIENIERWQKSFTEKEQNLAKYRDALSNSWSYQIEQRMASDPRFAAKVQEVWAGANGVNVASQPSKFTIDPRDLIPENFSDDPMARAIAEKMTNAISKVNENISMTMAEREMATKSELGRHMNELNELRQHIGRSQINREYEAMQSELKKLDIPVNAGVIDKIVKVAQENNIPMFNPDADADAFRAVAFPIIMSRTNGGGSRPAQISGRQPQKVMPSTGSGKSESQPLADYERPYFDMWMSARGKKGGTVAQWRSEVSRY